MVVKKIYMAARKCFASLTTVKLLTLEKVIALSGMALTEKDPRKESKNKLIMKIFNTKILQNTFVCFLVSTLHLPQILQCFRHLFFAIVQGVKVNSGKSLSSKFGRIQCLYCNKRYTSRKPLISALIWHLESDCSLKIVS